MKKKTGVGLITHRGDLNHVSHPCNPKTIELQLQLLLVFFLWIVLICLYSDILPTKQNSYHIFWGAVIIIHQNEVQIKQDKH